MTMPKWLPILVVLACTARPAVLLAGSNVSVRVSTQRASYLLGEPVPLKVSFENHDRQTIRTRAIFSEDLISEFVFVASDGGRFRQFTGPGVGCGPRETLELGAGSAWVFQVRVVYSWPALYGGELLPDELERFLPLGLALPKPGNYALRIEYPWGEETLVSNPVAIRVEAPEGQDARVWQVIRRPEVLYLMQTGKLPEGKERAIEDLLDALAVAPETRYFPAIRHALRHFCVWHRNRLAVDVVLRLCAVIGLTDEILRFSPEDERLDAPVTVPPGRTTLAGLLDSLSGQSGVPLEASPGTARDALWNAGRTDTLRAVMEQLARTARSQWQGSGVGGYRLIRSTSKVNVRRSTAARPASGAAYSARPSFSGIRDTASGFPAIGSGSSVTAQTSRSAGQAFQTSEGAALALYGARLDD